MRAKPFQYICILLCSLLSLGSGAQDYPKQIDSLKKELAQNTEEIKRAEIQYDIAVAFFGMEQPDSTIYYGKRSAASYEQGRNNIMASVILARVASVYASQKKYDEAIPIYKRSVQGLTAAREMKTVMTINSDISSIYQRKGDVPTALSYIQENINIAKQTNSDDAIMVEMSHLQNFYSNNNDAPMALKTGMELVDMARKKNNKKILAHAYLDLGNVYLGKENYTASINYYKLSLPLFEEIKDTMGVAMLNRNIGSSYLSLKNFDSAGLFLTEAQNIYKARKDASGMADVLNSLTASYSSQLQYDKAIETIKEAIQITKDPESKLFYRLNLYHMLANQLHERGPQAGDTTSMHQLNQDFSTALKAYEVLHPDQSILYSFYGVLADIKKYDNDYSGALDYYTKAVELRDSLNSNQKAVDFANLEAKFKYEAIQDSLKLADEQQRLELQKQIELKALRYEYEKKQAAAHSEEERKKLLLEEELKRQQIESVYDQKQLAAKARYDKERALANLQEEKRAALAASELKRSNNMRNMSLLGALLLFLMAGGAVWAYVQKRKDNKLIAAEKQKSESLLLNILPQEVADELKAKGSSKAQQYEEVSVLFTDFVNFTKISESLGVNELLEELNIHFTAFDQIMERYGLEKIKTIGDAYLAVSGLPVANPRHAQQAVLAALDILDFVAKRKNEVPYGLDIRIGINSGALIAGIIGVKKFAYDIWGDTVNIAARMEQNGAPGKVNISGHTFELVKADFSCTHRGKIEAKGKGAMDMYFVQEAHSGQVS